ncbi:MAG: Gfo/Idh/MocA family oxidoreductase [Oscillospiraceae bacterium]|jgi:predicted dehydrogenase|nr:Gfo/Idh/MocA family oxidoreductase [Oscillospiraceae bacterium]
MPDKKLQIGIIGTGNIARSHMWAYKLQKDAQVVALADIVPGRAQAFADKYGLRDARCYPDHLSLLEAEKDLDAVSVCTYNCAHRDCAVEAFRHGLNVLLEKPMCVTIEEAGAICKAEKESGKILCVGFQPRFDANMQNIKRIVESGQLGKVYYIQTGGGRRRGIPGSTFIEKETGGIGALGDIGCYSLDMVLNAVGYPKPLTVSGYTSDFFGKNPKYYDEHARFGVDDFGAAFVRLEGGIILDFRISWAMHPDSPGDTILFGTEGALRIPATDCWNGSVGGPMKLYFDTKSGRKTKKTVPLRSNLKQGTLWGQKIRSFLDAVKDGTPSPIPSWQILINQAIIDGINRSAALGKEVAVEIPEI